MVRRDYFLTASTQFDVIDSLKDRVCDQRASNRDVREVAIMTCRIVVFFLGFLIVGAAAQAGTVTVPYFGSFDEAGVPAEGGLPAGDYDTIGGLPDVGLFNLVTGSNTFAGSIFTPGDSADTFLIGIGSLQTLTGASIEFGTNLTVFNPMFAFPPPRWTLEESSPTPTIFDLSVGADGLNSPQLLIAPAFSRGAGIYNVLIGNGVFGTNSGAPIDYEMRFETSVVPIPAALPLFGTGLACLGLLGWRRKQKPAT